VPCGASCLDSIVAAPLQRANPRLPEGLGLKRESGLEGKSVTRFGSNVGTDGTCTAGLMFLSDYDAERADFRKKGSQIFIINGHLLAIVALKILTYLLSLHLLRRRYPSRC
jgi:hypothetical protein